MPETLSVHLNREELHAVEVPPEFEATGSFDVELVNHGTAIHTHLHLEGDVADVATIDASNHFVDGESRRRVHVTVDGAGPVSGKLKVASAYGAQTRYVDIDVVEPEEEEETVQVDESLSQPQPRDQSSSDSGGSPLSVLAANPELIVLVLGVGAVGIAAAAALVIDSPVVLGGALAVVVGVLVAVYVLVSS